MTMHVRHPSDAPPSQVSVNGRRVPVSDGTFEIDDDAKSWVTRFATAHDVEVAEILVDAAGTETSDADTCTVVKGDGNVCGRELPCQYHSDDAAEAE